MKQMMKLTALILALCVLAGCSAAPAADPFVFAEAANDDTVNPAASVADPPKNSLLLIVFLLFNSDYRVLEVPTNTFLKPCVCEHALGQPF